MIRLGVVGAGPITLQHLDVLAALPGVEIAALSSRRPEAREALGRRFGIPQVFEQYGELLEQSLDGVLVLVAPEAIAGVAHACLERRLPTFLEKPPGLTLQDATQLAEAADRHKVPTQVGLNRRFYSVVEAGRTIIRESGRMFGIHIEAPEDLARARAAGRSDEVLRRWVAVNSLHAIDLLRYVGGRIRCAYRIVSARDVCATSLAGQFEFESGAVGQYTAHWGSPGVWSMRLYGDDVVTTLSPLERGVARWRNGREVPLEPAPVDVTFKPGFYRQLECFVATLRNGRTLDSAAPDLADAAQSMELAYWLAGAGA